MHEVTLSHKRSENLPQPSPGEPLAQPQRLVLEDGGVSPARQVCGPAAHLPQDLSGSGEPRGKIPQFTAGGGWVPNCVG